MKTYFVRHTRNLGASDQVIRQLASEGRIAIHFGNEVSHDPNRYQGQAKGAFTSLKHLAEDGGYVCATYYGELGCMVGKVLPGSERIPLAVEWDGKLGEPLNLKTLQMDGLSVLRLNASRSMAVLIGRPRQQTIAEFGRAEDLIEVLVEHHLDPSRLRVQPSVQRLVPFQQEVMCSEYLRLPDTGLPHMRNLLFPVGRTLDNVDVIGVTDEFRNLYAQVTALDFKACGAVDNRTGRSKIADLSKCREERKHHLVLFCGCAQGEQNFDNGVHIVSLAHVYERFKSELGLRRWLWTAFSETYGSSMDLSSLESQVATNR